MSYDFMTLPQPCDHIIRAERMAISPDNRTLYSLDVPTQRMVSQVNGLNNVGLLINGVAVPRSHPVLGWDVLPDELSWPVNSRFKIVFNKPVLMRSLLIRCTYSTLASQCFKCRGTSKLSDFTPASNGSFTHVVQQLKLVQRILKYTMTTVCSFYPSFTCPLKTYIAKKFGLAMSSDDVSSVVSTALNNLIQVQAMQANYQSLDPTEILAGVTDVLSTPSPTDPRVLTVSVSVTTVAGTSSQVNIGMKASV